MLERKTKSSYVFVKTRVAAYTDKINPLFNVQTNEQSTRDK